MHTRAEAITAPDGQTFDGHLALPAAGRGPGVLVLQEIFGVNDYIREVCERLAALGYVAMAPDVFWRTERGVELGGDEAALQQAFRYSRSFSWKTGISDLIAALEHLRALPETGGRAAALGFCFGGTASFALACVGNPDVVVSYYGSGVPDWCDRADDVLAPVLLHFGSNDPYISADKLDKVRAWADEHRNATLCTYESGHAFDNHTSPMFSDPEAAAAAWDVTTRFLAEHHRVDNEAGSP